jgi:hypothetical protein
MAIPPGNTIAVWPPAGIALAAMLLWGARAWRGIWLGALLVNLWAVSGSPNAPSLATSIVVSAGIAAGSTLQALAGLYLIRRLIERRDPLERAVDVFRFAILSLVFCLIAATVGVTIMAASGLLRWADYTGTWWTWWLGDAAGVLLSLSGHYHRGQPLHDAGGLMDHVFHEEWLKTPGVGHAAELPGCPHQVARHTGQIVEQGVRRRQLTGHPLRTLSGGTLNCLALCLEFLDGKGNRAELMVHLVHQCAGELAEQGQALHLRRLLEEEPAFQPRAGGQRSCRRVGHVAVGHVSHVPPDIGALVLVKWLTESHW